MITGGIVTLHVADLGRAVRFYIETLGMKLVEEKTASSPYAVIDAGEGFRIGLRSGGAAGGGNGPAIDLETKVPIDEAIAIYENRGVTFTIERTESATIARFRDPDANLLSLIQKSTK